MVNVKELGISGDGLTDDTLSLQRVVDTENSLYFPAGDYCCNGLVIPEGKTLYSDGNATLVLDYPDSTYQYPHAIVLAGSNINVRNLTFQGNASKTAAYIDLDVGNLSDISFEGCNFMGLHRPIRVRAERINNRGLRNLFIRKCRFQNTVDRAIDFLVSLPIGGRPYSLQDIFIEDNHFEDIAPNSSGKGGESGNFDGAIYIGSLRSVRGFYLRNNIVYRAAPQFLAMSLSPNPREDFVISGNTIHQEGTEVVVNMSFTMSGIDGLVFDKNACYGVDYEHMVLRNCKNFKVTESHFEKANVGIAIHDVIPSEHSNGNIIGCTFQDVECPSDENDGNKAIFIVSDTAEVHVVGCHYRKSTGVKNQTGVEVNYRTVKKAPVTRSGTRVSDCSFEKMVGVVVKSGGSELFPGHAMIINSKFKDCPVAISFTHPDGNVVQTCSFEGNAIDLRTKGTIKSLRALYNIHRNTNPQAIASGGAYVIEIGAGKALVQVEGCSFRNVKGGFVLAIGSLLEGVRELVWENNSVDTTSTGIPQ